jgi:hypothetical protein
MERGELVLDRLEQLDCLRIELGAAVGQDPAGRFRSWKRSPLRAG